MKNIQVPDAVADQIAAILASAPPDAEPPSLSGVDADRQSVSTAAEDIAALVAMWRETDYMTRARMVRLILEGHPEVSRSMLADQVGVSAPAIGYHYRFNWLSDADQVALVTGKLVVSDAIVRASEAYGASKQQQSQTVPGTPVPAATVVAAAPAKAAALLQGSEDLDCQQEIEFANGGYFPEPAARRITPAGDMDEALGIFREWMGIYSEPLPCAPRDPRDVVKRVVINDTHIPYLCEDSFRRMIQAEAADTDELVVAGDLATMTYFASFPKFSRSYTPAESFFATTKFVTFLNETFPSVKIFGGNHDARFIKWLVRDRGIPPEVLEYFELLAPGFTDPLRIICRDLKNVEVLAPLEYEKAKFAFLYQFGDFVVGHAEKYSKIELRAVHNFAHWLKSFAEPTGLVGRKSKVGQDFRCVGQAHTHQAGKAFSDYALWIFELGCMCLSEEYVGSPKIQSERPWAKGYTVVYQDRLTGVTDINRSHFVHTGAF